MRPAILLIGLLLSGCAAHRVQELPVTPVPGGCAAVEARTSPLSTQGAIMCWHKDGRLAGMTGGPGAPGVQVPLVLLEAVSTVVGGYLIGAGLADVGKRVPADFTLDTQHTLDVGPGILGFTQ